MGLHVIIGQFVSPFNKHISEGSGFFFKFRVKFFATACGLGWLRLVLAVAKGGPGFFLMVDSGGVECAFMVGHERIYKKTGSLTAQSLRVSMYAHEIRLSGLVHTSTLL